VGPEEQTKAGNLIIEGNLTTKGILKLGQFNTADLPAGVEGALCFDTTKNIVQINVSGVWRDLIVSKLGLGETCNLDDDCSMGHCVNGVCCNTVCEGTCNRCNVAGSIGTCIEVPSDCAGGCSICSSGNCIADPTKCTGNCVQCTGSGAVYNCASNVALCIADCIGVCSGSGTAYNCQASPVGTSCGGGKIAYIDGTGLHGLIAALSDQSTGTTWGCYGTAISGADGTAIGTGHQNTHDMIAAGCTNTTQLTHGVTINGYSDWYLPSGDELNQLFINKVAIGGFVDYLYWSSTEGISTTAWFQHFVSGQAEFYNKLHPCYLRAVRSF